MDFEAIKAALVVMGNAMVEIREIQQRQLEVQEKILEILEEQR